MKTLLLLLPLTLLLTVVRGSVRHPLLAESIGSDSPDESDQERYLIVQQGLSFRDLILTTYSLGHQHVQRSSALQGRASRRVKITATVGSRVFAVALGNI